MADAAETSVVIPAFNEAASIGVVVRDLAAAAPWHEILVVDARSRETHASVSRRIGNATLNGIASFLTEQRIPDLTSGFRAARRDQLLEFLHLLPNGFSTPTTTTLAFIKAGYSVRFEPIDAAARQGASKIKLGADGLQFLVILLKVITI